MLIMIIMESGARKQASPSLGVWKDGRWNVMIRRELQAGYDDDVQFNSKKKYPFDVAVFDNEYNEDS